MKLKELEELVHANASDEELKELKELAEIDDHVSYLLKLARLRDKYVR